MESGRALKCSSIKRRSLWKSTSLGFTASGERLGVLGVAMVGGLEYRDSDSCVTIFEQECYQNVYMSNSGQVFNITSESSGAERISLRDCYCAQILCATQENSQDVLHHK